MLFSEKGRIAAETVYEIGCKCTGCGITKKTRKKTDGRAEIGDNTRIVNGLAHLPERYVTTSLKTD